MKGKIQIKVVDEFSSIGFINTNLHKTNLKQNGVIVFVPQDEIQNLSEKIPISQFLKKTRGCVKRCILENIPFVVVVTKMDLCDQKMTKDPNNFNDYPNVQKLLNIAAQIFHVSKCRVFPLVTDSFVDGEEGKHSLAKLVYRILDRVSIDELKEDDHDEWF